jgi:hypothetical protein
MKIKLAKRAIPNEEGPYFPFRFGRWKVRMSNQKRKAPLAM